MTNQDDLKAFIAAMQAFGARAEGGNVDPFGDAPQVYAAINAVMADVAKDGIAKDRKNEAQGFAFRGIDDVYNALSPILARHRLIILPRVLSRTVNERVTIKEYNGQKKESVLFYVAVEVEFDLIAAADGSKHTIKTYGEAMDSGDKATNKAMSAAFKYAAMQAFCIPTEGDNDADGQTHGDIVRAPSDAFRLAVTQVNARETAADLGVWWNAQKAAIKGLMIDAEYADLIQAVKARKADLEATEAAAGAAGIQFDEAA